MNFTILTISGSCICAVYHCNHTLPVILCLKTVLHTVDTSDQIYIILLREGWNTSYIISLVQKENEKNAVTGNMSKKHFFNMLFSLI